MTEHYEEITVCGKPALFTNFRIKRDTVPDSLYVYDVRHDDDCRGIPCEIAPFNHGQSLGNDYSCRAAGAARWRTAVHWWRDGLELWPIWRSREKSKALCDGGRVYESVSEPLIRASRVVPYKVQKLSQVTDGANRSSTETIFWTLWGMTKACRKKY